MQREILFKAKRKDNGEWIEGYLVEYIQKDTVYINGTSPKISYIFPMNERSRIKSLEKRIEVISETICEYTGLKDKNGVKIFENDIVYYNDFTSVYKSEITGNVVFTQDCMFEIEYDDKYIKRKKTTRPLVCHEHSIFASKKTKIIGNVFDEEVKDNE